MSLRETMDVTCPACHKTSSTAIWSSLNSETDPEAKKQLIEGHLFDFHCPECGSQSPLDYPMLYHDVENKVMIRYLTNKDELNNAVEEINEVCQQEHMAGYRYRIVMDTNALREKANIFDAGLDDRVVEIAKVYYSQQVIQQYQDRQFKNVYFLVNDQGKMFLQYLANRPLIIKFDQKVYDNIKADMSQSFGMDAEVNYQVDMEWAYKLLNSMNQNNQQSGEMPPA